MNTVYPLTWVISIVGTPYILFDSRHPPDTHDFFRRSFCLLLFCQISFCRRGPSTKHQGLRMATENAHSGSRYQGLTGLDTEDFYKR
jgi:hypothetical protein